MNILNSKPPRNYMLVVVIKNLEPEVITETAIYNLLECSICHVTVEFRNLATMKCFLKTPGVLE